MVPVLCHFQPEIYVKDGHENIFYKSLCLLLAKFKSIRKKDPLKEKKKKEKKKKKKKKKTSEIPTISDTIIRRVIVLLDILPL